MQYSFPNFIDSYGYRNAINDCHPLGMKAHQEDISPIHPSPFYASATFELPFLLDGATLIVYNSFGQVASCMEDLSGQSIVFYRNDLPAGMYFFSITENNKTISAGKFIIRD
jgi:hypothetical protein